MDDRGAFKVATQNDAPDEARRARYGVVGDAVNYSAQERRMHTVLSKFSMLEWFTSLSWERIVCVVCVCLLLQDLVQS
jgi:hypothetical protein